MIQLSFQNDKVFLFNVEDWSILRKEYRILGGLVGCLPSLPRQNIFRGMPMELSPEETIILIENNVACLVHWSDLLHEPNAEKKLKYDEEMSKHVALQNTTYRKKRILEIDTYLDKIVEGKKKCSKGTVIDRDVIRNIEINKIAEITTDSVLLPTVLDTPEYVRGKSEHVPIDVIKSKTNSVKLSVFRDLWNRGYYISDGINFGGDFLVYLGDPIEYHASYIVKCIYDRTKTIAPLEFLALGRLGNTVKKRILFATLNHVNGVVNYVMLKWAYD